MLNVFLFSKKQAETLRGLVIDNHRVKVNGQWRPFTEWRGDTNLAPAWDDATVVHATMDAPEIEWGSVIRASFQELALAFQKEEVSV